MKISTVMGGDPSLNTRLYVRRSATGPSSSLEGGMTVTLRRPTTAETFGRRLLNVLSFGAYTRHVANPREWNAFKAAVLAGVMSESRALISSNLSAHELEQGVKQGIDQLFMTFDQGQRLTRSKASVILDDIQREMNEEKDRLNLAAEGRVDLSQNAMLRALRTVKQRNFGAGQNNNLGALRQELATLRSELDTALQDAKALDPQPNAHREATPEDIDRMYQQARMDSEHPEANDDTQGTDDFDAMSDLADQRPHWSEMLIGDARQILNEAERVLRAGHPASNASGELALQAALGGREGAHLSTAYGALGLKQADGENCVNYLRTIPQALRANPLTEAQLHAPSSTSIVSIPIALRGGGVLTEDHSVLVALDLKHKQVIYLDAKGGSPRAAERHYRNAAGLQAGLAELGRAVFGGNWRPDTHVLMLSNAKQQGANDCFAFTHEFTRRLAEGQSVGDIERDLDELLRDGTTRPADPQQPAGTVAQDGIRARMARDIVDHVIKPRLERLNQDIATRRATLANQEGELA